MKNQEMVQTALERYVEYQDISKIRSITENIHPKDLYEIISKWQDDKIAFIIRSLTEEKAVELFDELEIEKQKSIVKSFTDDELANIFETIYSDEAIDILDEMPARLVKRILAAVDAPTRKRLNRLLQYHPNQVGSRMHVQIVSIKSTFTIKQAKEKIKQQIQKDSFEIAGLIYVTDNLKKFIGYVTPDTILSEKDSAKVIDFTQMITPLKTSDDMSKAQSMISDYELLSAPVVDSRGRLIGAIEADDIVERLEDIEEAYTEASTVRATSKPYMELSAWDLFKSRVSWIVLLIVIGSLTQIVIIGFQAIWNSTGFWSGDDGVISVTMSTIVTIAFTTAISVSSSINDAAGNSGSQSSATLVRAIALGEVSDGSYKNAIWKETVTGSYLGLISGVTAFFRTLVVWAIFGQLSFGGPDAAQLWGWMLLIAAISSFSFAVSIIIGNFLGAVLPVVAARRNWDGAVISGPVQTTIVDIITFTLYLGITTAIFVPLANSGVFGPPPNAGTDLSIISSISIAMNNILII